MGDPMTLETVMFLRRSTPTDDSRTSNGTVQAKRCVARAATCIADTGCSAPRDVSVTRQGVLCRHDTAAPVVDADTDEGNFQGRVMRSRYV